MQKPDIITKTKKLSRYWWRAHQARQHRPDVEQSFAIGVQKGAAVASTRLSHYMLLGLTALLLLPGPKRIDAPQSAQPATAKSAHSSPSSVAVRSPKTPARVQQKTVATAGDYPLVDHTEALSARSTADDRLETRNVKVREISDASGKVASAERPSLSPPTTKVDIGHFSTDILEAASQPTSASNNRAGSALVAEPHRHKGGTYDMVPSWSDAEIDAARSRCAEVLKGIDVTATEVEPIREGACGAPAPIRLSRIGSGATSVEIDPPVMLTCEMAAALHAWISKSVQPAALESFSHPVVRLASASSYACRNRYGRSDAPLSEHGVVNAIDLSGFVLSDGRTIRVIDGWGATSRDGPTDHAKIAEAKPSPISKAGLSMLGAPHADNVTPVDVKSTGRAEPPHAQLDMKDRKSAFLHKVHLEACDVFGTVLGPEANEAHRNHFHLDMKVRRHRSYCE